MRRVPIDPHEPPARSTLALSGTACAIVAIVLVLAAVLLVDHGEEWPVLLAVVGGAFIPVSALLLEAAVNPARPTIAVERSIEAWRALAYLAGAGGPVPPDVPLYVGTYGPGFALMVRELESMPGVILTSSLEAARALHRALPYRPVYWATPVPAAPRARVLVVVLADPSEVPTNAQEVESA